MTVQATCLDCEDTHPLGARERRPVGSTNCPSCGSPSYESSSNGDVRDANDVRERLRDVSGVGSTTLDRLERQFDLRRLHHESVERLTNVRGIGVGTATNIVEAVDDE